ncbi:MAG: histidine ammonia-lyase [Desulfatibacillaceae bacterium]
MERRKADARDRTLVVSDAVCDLADVVAVAEGRAAVKVSDGAGFLEKLRASCRVLDSYMDAGKPVYGVSTGYGSSCGNRPAPEHVRELGENLIRYHGCGAGEPLAVPQVRAAMLCRLICLAKGYSAVSPQLLQRIADFLNHGITPVVPCEGSVGASGDLTPMSYIAAALVGDRDVMYRGRRMPAADAVKQAGLAPYTFQPKEPLALINGTSVMSGIGALASARARRVLTAAQAACALSVHALAGHGHHYHATIFEAKPHVGQARVAAALRGLLETGQPVPEAMDPTCFQDPYSLRCAPQILGILADGLDWIESWLSTEINSANDNPITDQASGTMLMGGNFYGGHVAFAMDGLKAALANVCDMSDRQCALLVDPRFSRGLNENLALGRGDGTQYHHGFKGLQITASALAAEAQKLSMPASVFSRSTESHNQDKVSMGTIAARDAERACTLAERTVAVHLVTAARGCQLRGDTETRPALAPVLSAVEALSPPYTHDRPLDTDIEVVASAIRDGRFPR